ncbi:Gfo/Idh/MocA family protein [Leifsonia sp. YAF41]|uniref:Gfo/Idh/MocA family protein n=1 Tax=Leifsonia sp. YAF41 TaxID=3233086 RepID=UPI003F9C3931
MTEKLRIAVVGAGYWGPNLARNFHASPEWELVAICDIDHDRAAALAEQVGGARVVTSLSTLLDAEDIDAIAIATPARTHHGITRDALNAGKHVLVEKPLADTGERGRDMVRAAAERGLVLMADHTYCYTPAVQKIRELIAEGALGDILFIDSVRINLGLIRPDVDVFWDLAPHDLSIIDFVLPGGLHPLSVSAHGADPVGAGKSCVGYLALPLQNGAMAHVHVNWLSPTKIRQMIIGGTKRTLVWDDLNPQQRVSVYDRGVDLGLQTLDGSERTEATISYRLGDTWSPALPEREALGAMASEFAACIREQRPSRTDGAAGLRVLAVLEAANRSLEAAGAAVVPSTVPASATATATASVAPSLFVAHPESGPDRELVGEH